VSTHYINSQGSPKERKPFNFKKLSVDSSAKNSIILKMKRQNAKMLLANSALTPLGLFP
jgi:hypothetical protein